MVFVLASTISKIIHDEVKGKKHGHRKTQSTSASSRSSTADVDKPLPLTPPQLLQINTQLAALHSTKIYPQSAIEKRYDMASPNHPPPAYEAYRPEVPPKGRPNMVRLGSRVVPWGPDDIWRPVEDFEDKKRRELQYTFELEGSTKEVEEASPQVFELEGRPVLIHRRSSI